MPGQRKVHLYQIGTIQMIFYYVDKCSINKIEKEMACFWWESSFIFINKV